ncbi:L,D-transpeptidase family protein [Sulfurovum sp. zt1-1]|uniref:L,D-transpeptidase family protein n=1 Tax=Sulfurovum zhangzhouensis TaxID=3019067 RepID=A0ABT7R218_9BACT|nr:L,D-transpeptidase family protein [Sulfurovum zhangzhouensis]MDM5272586.1 L,D-transpeptidase family protein [Sulfurovum zhangzhouensis]
MKLKKLLWIGLFIQTLTYGQVTVGAIQSQLQTSLQKHIKGQNKDIIQALYASSGNQPLWLGDKNEQKRNELIRALKDPLFNYKDKPFDQPSIAGLYYMLDNNNISSAQKAKVYARLDLMLTNSFVRLVRFIVQGDVDWDLVQKKLAALETSDDIHAVWEMETKPFPNQNELYSAIENGNIDAYLSSLIPMEKRYRKLVKLLKDYRTMEKFPKIEYTKEPRKMGSRRNKNIAEIKKRLQIIGDYPKDAPINTTFDKALQEAVISYQKRYNLKVDGQIDKVMTYYLNQPVKNDIQSIITNLDKTKLYPKEFEDEYVEVNIPDFKLRYYKSHRLAMRMGAVVGRIDRPTPLFSDKIEYMVLNPTWTITDNLVKRDLIPVLKEHPSYLIENNIKAFSGNKEVDVTYEMIAPYKNSDKPVPYSFVQQPGPDNALGRVKFMFPNKYSVYLHDTDNKSLLTRRYRIYSSGCMRVQKPFDLMNTLLTHTKGRYTKEKIDQILESNTPTTITLSSHIPVHITYFTVFEEDGKAHFKNDIYLYDQIISESIIGRSKPTFTVPDKRVVSVKKNAKPLSN